MGIHFDQAAPIRRESFDFTEWFANSKVLDSNGDPLVVYHGSRAVFEQFDRTFGAAGSINQVGSWFATDPRAASLFASGQTGSNVQPVHLAMRKPLYLDSTQELLDLWQSRAGGQPTGRGGDVERLREWLISEGYDGFAIEASDVDAGVPGLYLLVLEPNQIASVYARDLGAHSQGSA